MQVTGNDRLELASYQLKDVSYMWFSQLKDIWDSDASAVTWKVFYWRSFKYVLPERVKGG